MPADPERDVAAALRLLAHGKRASEWPAEALQAALGRAARLLEETDLLPPTAARLSSRFGTLVAWAALATRYPEMTPAEAGELTRSVGAPGELELQELRERSAVLLQAYLRHVGEPGAHPEPARSEANAMALGYAALIVRQADLLEQLTGPGAPPLAPADVPLDACETRRLEEFFLYSEGRTIPQLLEDWRRCVRALGEPVPGLLEDYPDRLARRDRLDEALRLLAPSARTPLDAAVADLDARFAELTRSVSDPVRRPGAWRPLAWWWYRAPRRAS